MVLRKVLLQYICFRTFYFRKKIMRCSRRRSRCGNNQGNPQCRFHMKTTVQTANDNFTRDSVEWLAEGDPEAMADYSGYYCETYKELAELVGTAAVIKIWRHYSGLTITFPRQLYSREYIREYIAANIGIMKPKEIAKNVGLTERRVRQIIHDIKAGESERDQDGLRQ